MKYLFFIFPVLIIFSCNNAQESDVATEQEIPGKVDQNVNPTVNEWTLISSHPALEIFLIGLKQNVETHNTKGIYSLIDPLQMGIQSKDMKMDSCQNVKELFNLKKSDFNSDCELLNNISVWNYKGYKKIDAATFDVRGKAKLEDGTVQDFALLINQLAAKIFVITGAVG